MHHLLQKNTQPPPTQAPTGANLRRCRRRTRRGGHGLRGTTATSAASATGRCERIPADNSSSRQPPSVAGTNEDAWILEQRDGDERRQRLIPVVLLPAAVVTGFELDAVFVDLFHLLWLPFRAQRIVPSAAIPPMTAAVCSVPCPVCRRLHADVLWVYPRLHPDRFYNLFSCFFEWVVGILAEFLEVAITSVVFHKAVYPADAFERRRYMNLVVHRAKHPELRDYIHSAVFDLLPFLHQGVVERVAVIFCYRDNIPVEKFVFEVGVNWRTSIREADLQFSLRSFLVKLSVSQPLTKVVPRDCRWEITAYFRSLPGVGGATKDKGLWIPTHTKPWQLPPLITPIKSITSEPLSVQLYLEHPNSSEA
ncbi:hypothetical protein Tsubulata_009452 [Turnera subulata]|uniref:HORMA domain-containing protein n=1 Tax=Turnera subulata TaxID=218843 RepID=A0A9Q0JQL3_9ROSI|nr:hypothetical protein Tsubulata_009452 [Turnera subulata]